MIQFAQSDLSGIQGLREDATTPMQEAAGGIGFQSLAQLLIALAIVVILIRWLVPKYASKFGKKSKLSVDNPDIEELGMLTLGTNQAHLIKVRGRTLLVGSGTQGVSLLADLTEESGVFYLPIQEAAAPKPQAYVESSQTDFDSVLERLNRLSA